MEMWSVLVLFLVELCSGYTSAQLGRTCTTPNAEAARCTPIYSCPVLYNVLTTSDPEVLAFLQASFCERTSDDVVWVCCGTKASYVTTKQNVKTALLPDRNTCGFQDQDKILGGDNTALEEFPWLALLKYKDKFKRVSFSCGGSLISPRYVLTAGHCITLNDRTVVAVRLGEWNIDTVRDCIGQGRYTYCNSPVDVEVESFKRHEQYNYDPNRGVNNDIALLRLKTSVGYTNFIRPICLPKASERSEVGRRLYASGWGHTSVTTKAKSPIKQKVLLPVVSPQTCNKKYKAFGDINIGDKQLCAGGEGGKDSCQGDSGGPLMRTTAEDPSQYYIEGIVSFGISCGTDLPGVYTRVSEFLDWIEDNVKP